MITPAAALFAADGYCFIAITSMRTSCRFAIRRCRFALRYATLTPIDIAAVFATLTLLSLFSLFGHRFDCLRDCHVIERVIECFC